MVILITLSPRGIIEELIRQIVVRRNLSLTCKQFNFVLSTKQIQSQSTLERTRSNTYFPYFHTTIFLLANSN